MYGQRITKEEQDNLRNAIYKANNGNGFEETCMSNAASNLVCVRFTFGMLLDFHKAMNEIEARKELGDA